MPTGNGHSPSSRLVIVSNRLPITIKSESDGEISITRSTGGLATALAQTHTEAQSLCARSRLFCCIHDFCLHL